MNFCKLVCLAVVFVAVLAFGAVVQAQYRQYAAPTLTLPLYGAGLATEKEDSPPPGDDRLSRLEAKVDKIQATLDRLLKLAEEEAAGPPTPARGAAQPNQAALNSGATKCANCHAPAVAEKKGDGFVMFVETPNGLNFSSLRAADRKRIVDKVGAGEMPKPPHQLSTDEKAAIIAAFSSK